MFAAATAAASADVRSKRNRYAAARSFSASDLMQMKRKQKLQTANALDILSTYLVTSISTDEGRGHRAPSSSSRTTSVSSNSRDSSRACSPGVDESTAFCSLPPCRSNSAAVRKSSSFLNHLFPPSSHHHGHHSHNSSNHQHPQANPTNLPLQSNKPLARANALSQSTSSIDSGYQAVAVTAAMLKNPAWGEIARLSSDEFDEVDGQGHRCGHRRRLYDRQTSPFAQYMARKRFISAINRVRMESMVCSALNSRKTSSTSAASTTDFEQAQQQPQRGQLTKNSSGSLGAPPPSVIVSINEESEAKEPRGSGSDLTDVDSISMNELRAEIESNTSPHRRLNSYDYQHPRASPVPGRASSSPQIPPQLGDNSGDNWAPLMQGRPIDGSTTSLYAKSSCMSPNYNNSNQRQRSSSATSMSSDNFFLNSNVSTITECPQCNGNVQQQQSQQQKQNKTSFMALIRIKMFSVKRKQQQQRQANSNTANQVQGNAKKMNEDN